MFLNLYNVLHDGLKMSNAIEKDLINGDAQSGSKYHEDLRAWSQKAQLHLQTLVKTVRIRLLARLRAHLPTYLHCASVCLIGG